MAVIFSFYERNLPTAKGKIKIAEISFFIAGSLESAYSLNWGGLMRFGDRVEGRPWHFYDK